MVEVKMILTVPFCPLADQLINEVKKKIMKLAKGRDVNVVLIDEA